MPNNDPLPTDERVPGRKAPADFESLLLRASMLFVVIAFSAFFMSVWPYFVFDDLHRLTGLLRASAFGLIPALIFGAIATHRAGTVGAAAFFGGSLSVGIFLHLRIQQLTLGYEVRELAKPEYAPNMQWVLPLAWLAVCTALVGLMSYLNPQD